MNDLQNIRMTFSSPTTPSADEELTEPAVQTDLPERDLENDLDRDLELAVSDDVAVTPLDEVCQTMSLAAAT